MESQERHHAAIVVQIRARGEINPGCRCCNNDTEPDFGLAVANNFRAAPQWRSSVPADPA